MKLEIVTYTLQANDLGTEAYYRDVARFTDEVLEKAGAEPGIPEIAKYAARRSMEPEDVRISVLEFLMIGVFWRSYGKFAAPLSLPAASRWLPRLYAWKSKGPRVRWAVDLLKGCLNTAQLEKKRRAELRVHVRGFGKLIRWLQATGEFGPECRRLAVWLAFLRSRPESESRNLLLRAIRFAGWFERRSRCELGKYTPEVDAFIKARRNAMRWKENLMFCTRGRVEYHLNMVGAELMNRAYRERFLRTKKKKVLLPICMRLKGEASCQAVRTDEGWVCQCCAKNCQVNRISAMGRETGFTALLIPHASTAFDRRNAADMPGETGIIGVACLLNLISGGYRAKELGFEPQCVLLNYAGCVKHWHPEGIATSIDLNQLQRILQDSP